MTEPLTGCAVTGRDRVFTKQQTRPEKQPLMRQKFKQWAQSDIF